jgi:hypothetical protein
MNRIVGDLSMTGAKHSHSIRRNTRCSQTGIQQPNERLREAGSIPTPSAPAGTAHPNGGSDRMNPMPGNNSSHTGSRAAYCPRCETLCPVVKTVSWQDDICAECGSSIPAQTDDTE